MSEQCYNKGCGKKFDSAQNSTKDCRHHPGAPYFHDAKKIWTCCNKSSTDFSDFLAIPGCQLGLHSNEKPVDPERPTENAKKDAAITEPEVSSGDAAPHLQEQQNGGGSAGSNKKLWRPPLDSEMTQLAVSQSASLRPALEKLLSERAASGNAEESVEQRAPQIGDKCRNSGCNATFQTELENESSTCRYHPGSAVFHEGMKFWSCCNRRTSDFDAFLQQVGCATSPTHRFAAAAPANNGAATAEEAVRFDWFQTGSHVTLSFYTKHVMPESVCAAANGVRVRLSYSFDGGRKLQRRDFALHGIIDVAKSCVKLTPNKLELEMKKAEAGRWPQLEIKLESEAASS